MCFVWISEQTAIISLYNINWLVFVTKAQCVYCAGRTVDYIKDYVLWKIKFHINVRKEGGRARRWLRKGKKEIRNSDTKLWNSLNSNFLFPPVITNYGVSARINKKQFSYCGQDHIKQYETWNNQTTWFLWLRCKFITGCQRARDVVTKKWQPDVWKPSVLQYVEVSKHTEVMACYILVVTRFLKK